MYLTNKVALITGSAKRTGKTIALEIAKAGADVWIHYRSSKEEAEETLKQVKSLGATGDIIQGDISSALGATHIIEQIGKIDVLVNNVGNFLVKDISEISPAEWDEQLLGTVSSTFYMCHAALPQMVKQKFGRIVNIGDAGAELIKAWKDTTPYMIGKTGVVILTKSLAMRYAAEGITINCVSPGMLDNSIVKPPNGAEDIPAKRYGTPIDIANAVNFLLQPNSSYITGENIVVSGGWKL